MAAAKFKNAWGYQGDNMNLPVADLAAAVPFYERVMGFRLESQTDGPPRSCVLERDGIRIGLAENGGDPEQDGCAFEVDDIEAVHEEFRTSDAGSNAPDLEKKGSISSDIKVEKRGDGSSWRVFFVIAPDGLCYWLGERQQASSQAQ